MSTCPTCRGTGVLPKPLTHAPKVVRQTRPEAISKFDTYTWAHVSKKEWPGAGKERHIVRRGGVDSLCSTTALPASTWCRRKTDKPDCVACVARAHERGITIPS